MTSRIALVSCVKTKRQDATAAEHMYISSLFKGMRRYAAQYADSWFILSAEYGVLRPNEIIRPYERTLNTMPKQARTAWAEGVNRQLIELLPAESAVVLLAGKRYREHIIPFLTTNNFSVEVPMRGLSFGQQLRWLNEQNHASLSS